MAAGQYEGRTPGRPTAVEDAERVTGWWYFAGILLTIAGVLNIIWGIVAISESHFFTSTGAVYIFGHLNTWGWIMLILGVPRSSPAPRCSPAARSGAGSRSSSRGSSRSGR